MRNSAIGCACLLAVFEGVGIMMSRAMAPPPIVRFPLYLLFSANLFVGSGISSCSCSRSFSSLECQTLYPASTLHTHVARYLDVDRRILCILYDMQLKAAQIIKLNGFHGDSSVLKGSSFLYFDLPSIRSMSEMHVYELLLPHR